MKKIFLSSIVVILTVLFTTTTEVYSQALGDTLLLYANPSGTTIDAQITADQANNPPSDRVYLLQQTGPTDTVYFYNANINATYNLTIVGKPNPITGMLPIIAPGLTASNTSPTYFLDVTSNGKTLTLENLYYSNRNINGVATTNGSSPIQATADSVTLILNHCVLDGLAKSTYVFPNGNYDKIKIANCEFRDMQYTKFGGGVIYYGKGLPSDSIIIKNSTMFCVNGRVFGETGPSKYFEFDHNTVFFAAVETGWGLLDAPWTDASITNNIFYCTNVLGQDTSHYISQKYDGSYRGNQVIAVDSLNNIAHTLGDTSESDRHIVVENNAYFWPKDYTDYMYSVKDDTGGAIVQAVWMNALGTEMFSNKTNWPNLVALNNMNIDPGFDSSYVSQVMDSLKPYISDFWANGTSTHNWVLFPNESPLDIYLLQGNAVPNNWSTMQGYPVPENLKYSNSTLYTAGTDGQPLGDLNWFVNITGIKKIPNATPAEFKLSQNYPNPFNPATNIEYSITKSGFVSLRVYNILGQVVETLQKGFQKAGSYKVDFNASKLASGVYLYRLQTNGYTKTKKMILMK